MCKHLTNEEFERVYWAWQDETKLGEHLGEARDGGTFDPASAAKILIELAEVGRILEEARARA